LQALRRGLARSDGFGLFLAVCDNPVTRDGLIGVVGDSMPGRNIQTVKLAPETLDALAAIRESIGARPGGPVMLVGVEEAVDPGAASHPLLASLNLNRPEWPSLGQPVVFWVPERLVGLLLREAPDFFDWRSDTLYFPEVAATQFRVLGERAWPFGADPNLAADDRRRRVAELLARIAASRGSDDPVALRASARWWDEVADNVTLLGDVDEALRIRQQEQLPVYERLGDVRSRAVTMGKIADILQARGQLDEALRIRQQEELPVYERLGDVRSRAITMGQIADILQARGQLDEALRIRQEEELPVYERLGDVRSRAITMGKIADILQARGQLDEAVHIVREEVLPVFERLGAARDLFGARARLAMLVRKRGQPGDEEEASRLLTAALGEAKKLKLAEAAELRQLIEQFNVSGATRPKSGLGSRLKALLSRSHQP